nr:hypothetical protein [Acetobacter persici]
MFSIIQKTTLSFIFGMLSLTQSAYADTDAAQKAIRASPNVLDLYHDPDKWAPIPWTIGMLSTNYGGDQMLRNYCHLLKNYGITNQHIRIVDIWKIHIGQTTRAASLGQINCQNEEIYHP